MRCNPPSCEWGAGSLRGEACAGMLRWRYPGARESLAGTYARGEHPPRWCSMLISAPPGRTAASDCSPWPVGTRGASQPRPYMPSQPRADTREYKASAPARASRRHAGPAAERARGPYGIRRRGGSGEGAAASGLALSLSLSADAVGDALPRADARTEVGRWSQRVACRTHRGRPGASCTGAGGNR